VICDEKGPSAPLLCLDCHHNIKTELSTALTAPERMDLHLVAPVSERYSMVYLPDDCHPLATTIQKSQTPGYVHLQATMAMQTAKFKHVSVVSITANPR